MKAKNSTSEMLSEPVFYNTNMMIGNKVIRYTQWVDNGVFCIAHFKTYAAFMKENAQFCSLGEFNTRFGTTADF